MIHPDHPYSDPGDGRTECDVCGKWIYECIHSCNGVPVTDAAWDRWFARHGVCRTCGTKHEDSLVTAECESVQLHGE